MENTGKVRVWVRRREALGARMQRFAADTGGTLVVFGMMLFLLMIMMGGIAVDLMRYESTRTSLQNTLDRSTLAAASLTQALDPESVVDDYFLKAGLSQYLRSVSVDEGMNYRQVTADATADARPMFLQMLGIDQFDANGHSQAEQRINNVEIVLVLDVSGSMASNSKIQNLKTAADEFIDTVMSSDGEGKISIAIVPFNGQVNLTTTLASKYNIQYPSGAANVNCVDLPTSVYTDASMSRTTPMSATANADTYSSSSTANSFQSYTSSSSTPNSANLWCPPLPGNVVRLPAQDIATMQGYINGLTAIGATSINAGIKWGMALLDPGSRDMFTELIASGDIPSALHDRPFDYDDREAMKVIVLMTDGENFAEERVNDAYKSGLSTIYKSNNDGNYSAFVASATAPNQYYVPHLGTFQAQPWTNSTNSGTYTQQTWPQVWAAFRVSYVAWQFYARPIGGSNSTARTNAYNAAMSEFKTLTPTTTMDTQLQTICSTAKTNGVIVYGIAFEAPTNGQTQIRNCATSDAHYFNATGLQIQTAFRAIANNISQLRLTQ